MLRVKNPLQDRLSDSLLVVAFTCKVEAQFGDFSIAAFKELVYAPGNEVFVYLELNALRTSDIV